MLLGNALIEYLKQVFNCPKKLPKQKISGNPGYWMLQRQRQLERATKIATGAIWFWKWIQWLD